MDSEFESDDPLDTEDSIENESLDDIDGKDKFDIEDSLILGGAMGLAYEAGLNERERSLLKKQKNGDTQL